MNEEKDIEKYLAEVRHDLRNELAVTREGISQVLDSLGNKDCCKCFRMLKSALESADRLNKRISDISISGAKYGGLRKY